MPYNPVCECCHHAPKMDRSGCCEECWYSGRYHEATRDERTRRVLARQSQRRAERWAAEWELLCARRGY